MHRLACSVLGLAAMLVLPAPASAQLSNMPPELRERLAEINPGWGKDILGNVAKTLALYTPILAAAPKSRRDDPARRGLRCRPPASARPAQAGRPHRRADRRLPARRCLCSRRSQRQRGSVWQCRHLLRAPGDARRQRNVPAGAGGAMARSRTGRRPARAMAEGECGRPWRRSQPHLPDRPLGRRDARRHLCLSEGPASGRRPGCLRHRPDERALSFRSPGPTIRTG